MTTSRSPQSPRLPLSMKAARIHQYGDASAIRYEDVPLPAPAAGEVLVRVAATAFNPTETALRAGLLHGFLPVDLPFTLGWDVAGVVTEVGPGVRDFAIGDRVVGRLDGGAGAAYVAAPARLLAAAPTSVPLAHAAALPVAGLTAWQAVFEHGRVKEGQRVLVNGAGGGVGGFATQLAAHAGADVTATASARSAAAVRRQGARRILDYTTTPLAEGLPSPVDLLLNLVPVTTKEAAKLPALVRPGGHIVSIATPIPPDPVRSVTSQHMVARNDVSQLEELIALVDGGAVTLDITETRPLEELADVHRSSESGGVRGKVLLVPGGDSFTG
ncbi:NADP-dependent oxidoreductase [Streptomyces sp. NPDC056169]|uniref:NADP-dependent oxidoreductase n=1 Tax=Streptomyces sp. NPDC056169 TaxID=3345734 RepID=UPI0035DBA8C9